ncbi:hypothetical protein [Flavobacterium sp. 7A]|uniref:hypothetical protein n=1 Tax=Flavobacterium sp. 7A TaxID=2940571 RepID=UPI002226D6CA|nr:hypothetical protein [Flavobacterium sp. 7A]MCW2121154.1 hypothetical protein [Flavobacterium sp. 7A]
MTITYQMDEKDFLIHQLYIASQSTRIKKKRFRSKIITPIIYTDFAFLFLYQEDYFLIVIFLVVAVL